MAGAKGVGFHLRHDFSVTMEYSTFCMFCSQVQYSFGPAESTAEVWSNILSFDQLCHRQPIKLCWNNTANGGHIAIYN